MDAHRGLRLQACESRLKSGDGATAGASAAGPGGRQESTASLSGEHGPASLTCAAVVETQVISENSTTGITSPWCLCACTRPMYLCVCVCGMCVQHVCACVWLQCLNVCVHVCMYTQVCMGTCAMCMGLSVCMCVCTCVSCACTCVYLCVCVCTHALVQKRERSRLWRSCGERSLDTGEFRIGSVTWRRKWEPIARCVCANPPQEASARRGGM